MIEIYQRQLGAGQGEETIELPARRSRLTPTGSFPAIFCCETNWIALPDRYLVASERPPRVLEPTWSLSAVRVSAYSLDFFVRCRVKVTDRKPSSALSSMLSVASALYIWLAIVAVPDSECSALPTPLHRDLSSAAFEHLKYRTFRNPRNTYESAMLNKIFALSVLIPDATL